MLNIDLLTLICKFEVEINVNKQKGEYEKILNKYSKLIKTLTKYIKLPINLKCNNLMEHTTIENFNEMRYEERYQLYPYELIKSLETELSEIKDYLFINIRDNGIQNYEEGELEIWK